MSNKNEPANNLLTADGPISPNGLPSGSQNDPAPPEGATSREPEKVVPPAVTEAQTAPSAANLLGLPDTLPETWCPNCKADVKPKGKGHCPRCGRVLKGAFLSRRHPVNLLRRDQLLAKLTAEYRPQSTILLAACEHLASVLEQLESLKAGSQEHKRLVDLSQQLGATLEASRHAEPPSTSDLTSATDDELIARLSEHLRLLLNQKHFGDRELFPCHPNGVDGGPDPDADVMAPDAERSENLPKPPTATPCEHCRQPLWRCDDIKTTNPEAWSVLHHDHPDEVERRRQDATAVMNRPGASRMPDWYL